jgi:hypothetical protein
MKYTKDHEWLRVEGDLVVVVCVGCLVWWGRAARAPL